MSPVARRINKTTQMSITSLIDILTILLLFVMVNVSSDPDMVPEGIELEESLMNEQFPDNSKIISLNVSYTGRDSGVITYKDENSPEQIPIARLEEINNTTNDIMTAKTVALDATLQSILGNDIGDTPVVVKVKAHKNTPFKYINTIKSMLIDIWNDENSAVSTRSKSNEFKLFLATDFVKSETDEYYRLLRAYGLGGL
jgi:biopolymer transport protein ExbD